MTLYSTGPYQATQSTLTELHKLASMHNCQIREGEREHLPIYPLNKSISRQKPNSPRQQPINRTRQETITEKQQPRHEPCYIQLEHVIPDAVRKDPERTTTSGQETLPPPVVVFSTELGIRGDDGYFGNCDQEDEGDGA